MSEKLLKLVEAIAEKKKAENAKNEVEKKRKDDILAKSKGKKLTDSERIDRIEEWLGIK